MLRLIVLAAIVCGVAAFTCRPTFQIFQKGIIFYRPLNHGAAPNFVLVFLFPYHPSGRSVRSVDNSNAFPTPTPQTTTRPYWLNLECRCPVGWKVGTDGLCHDQTDVTGAG